MKALFLGFCLGAFAISGWAQGTCRLPVQNLRVTTTGGVSYLSLTAQIEYCWQVGRTEVTRSDTNLSVAISQYYPGTFCVPLDPTEPPAPYFTTVHIVLGVLGPGRYALRLRGTSSSFPLFFEVPQQESLIDLDSDGTRFTFRMNGFTNMTYVIEQSTTLANWVPIATNRTASVAFTNLMAGESSYFRVRVQDQVRVFPSSPCP